MKYQRNLPNFKEPRSSVTVFTRTSHLSLFWARSLSPALKVYFSIILPPRIRLSRCPPPLSDFFTKTWYVLLLSPTFATCLSNFIRIYWITHIFNEGWALWNSYLSHFLHLTRFLQIPVISLITLFSDTLSPFILSTRKIYFWHPYQTGFCL